MNREIGIRINNLQSFAPDKGVSSGGNKNEPLTTRIVMPTSPEELAARLNEMGIIVTGEVGSNKWFLKARGAYVQGVREQGGRIMGSDAPKKERSSEQSLNGHKEEPNPNGEYQHTHENVEFGQIHTRTDIRSTEGPFLYLPEKRVHYPEKVTRGLGYIQNIIKRLNHSLKK
jgi:hypothetical protein